ncbi:OmpA family protein [Sphingopyxis sp.]|uniref:OmpA family protein n=1 Tax=Sphingopyxis sp. TaxID=1908224 RepID=UPI003D136A49
MTRGLALLAGAAMLTACSPGDAARDQVAAQDESGAETATAAASSAALPTGTRTVGDGMTAQVSDLKGDVSGLDVRITDLGTVIDLPADALFEFDKADLTPAAAGELAKVAELIRPAPPGAVQVIGHTDAKGDDAYNQRLSEARAKTVADWFGQQVGVRHRQFTISGKGETAPVAPNETADGKDNPAGRTKNRRVEVVIPR